MTTFVFSGRLRRPGRADTHVAQALALWRGEPYSKFESTRFGRAEATRLGEVRLLGLESRWTRSVGEPAGRMKGLVIHGPVVPG